MIIDIINSIIDEIPTIIKMVLSFFLGIFFTPLRKWVYSESKECCTFPTPIEARGFYKPKDLSLHDIIVTKHFSKTKNISCPWYKSSMVEIKKYKGKKYYYCPYGVSFDSKIKDRVKCPFG